MALTWPASIKPRDVLFHPQNASRSGGASTNGLEQVIGSGAGRWRASVTAWLRTDAQILAWRSVLGQLLGRAGTINVPVFDNRRAPWPVDAYGRTLHPGFTRDKRLDGTPYEAAAIPTESAVAVLAQITAAVRAVQMTISITQGSVPTAGQYFGVGNKLYLITAVSFVSGVQYLLSFWPGLRVAVPNGTPILFTGSMCEMRLTSDDDGSLLLERLRTGSMVAEFVEAL